MLEGYLLFVDLSWNFVYCLLLIKPQNPADILE
jgi:hypothetical protein